MRKYIPVNPEPVEAVQWFKHGDHPDVHENPKDSTAGLIDHDVGAMGYSGKHITVVYPGEYVIKDYESVWTLGEDEFKREYKLMEVAK